MNCEDFKKIMLSDTPCCSSCHEDDDLGYFDLLEIYDENDKLIGFACCRIADEWEQYLEAKNGKK